MQDAPRRPAKLARTTPRLALNDAAIQWTAIRAQGPGGQHVNKSATAVQLRLDVAASGLPPDVQARLRALPDSRITADGMVLIKAQNQRSQEHNKADALARLHELLALAAHVPKRRKATRPTAGSVQRRLQSKAQRGEVKAGRGKVLG
jgi:ribosome-associated protein